MPSDVMLEELEISGFRGFRDPVKFTFSGSAVILAGPNGTGKTSFFDAIQWLLVGELDRLVPFRARKNSEHIVNTYRRPEPAYVSGRFRGPESHVVASRRGTWEQSTLEVAHEGRSHYGAEAESVLRGFLCRGSEVPLQVLLQNAGILQQDVMRHVLEAHPGERHEYISALLGLSALEGLQSAVLDAGKTVKQRAHAVEEEHRSATAAAEAHAQRVRALKDSAVEDSAVEAARERLVSQIAALEQRAPIVVRDHEQVAAQRVEFGEVRAFVERLRQRRGVLAGVSAGRGLAELGQEQEQIQARSLLAMQAQQQGEERLRVASHEWDAAEARAADLDRLAALALDLLTEHCPACEQSIDAEQVADRLRSRTADAGPLATLRAERDRLSDELVSLSGAAAEADEAVVAIGREVSQRQELEVERARLEDEVRQLRTRDRTVALSLGSLDDALATDWDQTVTEISSLLDRIEHLQDLTRSAGGAVEIDRLETESDGLGAEDSRLAALVEAAQERSARAESLARAIGEARTVITDRRFAAIQPLVEDIYSRLDPHPTFKVLEFDHAMYRSKPTTNAVVRDSIEEIDAEPLLVFSSSQANIVALSYFLAVGVAAVSRRLPFVMLDDPLQSMDDVNVLGFADLCRYIRRDRQMFVSTHDKRFASLLERKLVSRGDDHLTEVIEFWGWDRSGPTFTQRTLDPLTRSEVPYPLVESSRGSASGS